MLSLLIYSFFLAGVAPSCDTRVRICCRESARSCCLHFDDGDASLYGVLMLRVPGVGEHMPVEGLDPRPTDPEPSVRSVFFSQSKISWSISAYGLDAEACRGGSAVLERTRVLAASLRKIFGHE
jgi:hypothetical protein